MSTHSKTGVKAGNQGPAGRLDRYFEISERGSTVGREVRGGLVTFFTMAYIVVLNPLILGFAADKSGHFLGAGRATGRTCPRSPPVRRSSPA